MLNKTLTSALAGSALALGLVFAGSASADVITCSTDPTVKTSDARAQGADEDSTRIADDCAYIGDTGSANPIDETTAVNDKWFLGEEDEEEFFFVGKTDFNENGTTTQTPVVGWTFEASKLASGVTINNVEYFFGFTLKALNPPGTWVGESVDFVLGLKDGAAPAGGGFAAYLWRDIKLDIDGQFRSYFKDPFTVSHASGFVRSAEFFEEEENGVPEPATLGLLGLGLVAMGALRRRKVALKS